MSKGMVSGRKLPTPFWINLGIIVLGTYLYVLTLDFSGMSGMLPRMVLIMIGIATVADLIQLLRNKQPPKTTSAQAACRPPDPDNRLHYDKVFYLAVLMPVYYLLLRLVGLIFSTFVFVWISGWILGYRKKVSLLLASAVVTAAVYVIFIVIMETFLPQSLLIGLIGG
jgi:uncharacterized membrane protein YuzA (DUF378 family)